MKSGNFDVHGVFCICNTGGIEVHLEEGYDPFVYWRFSIMDTKPQKWHRAKINETATGRSFFRARNMRVYLDQVTRV